MTTPSLADIELSFYEKFFFSRNIEPYPVQEEAFSRIFAGESVLVTVPTGTGKTLMAKAGIWRALKLGNTAVYTTPLRALTEEKFRELCEDFGEEHVGFATGDYKVNPQAPIQVLVAEILWNRIFSERVVRPADIVIMDEGHYFNSPDRGYVWEQSIIGLDPRSQLVILSATIGNPEQFCQWVQLTRRVPMALVRSEERRVPLYHQYREAYLIEVVRDLAAKGECPAIIFVFGRELCFETARLLKSCRRFTTDEEVQRIASMCEGVLLDRGSARDLRPLLIHGIGIHHAGVLPRYKRLVEQLTLERLLKFIVSTETISAGINLPAKRVIFPSLRKVIKSKPRLIVSEEYHQMAGRAGRPQFDREGIAITLAPEQVVQELRKELKEAQRGGRSVDEARVRRAVLLRARAEAQRNGDVIWDEETHQKLVAGRPAPLRSQTQIAADQILAIGLPDLTQEQDPQLAQLPVSMNLNMPAVVANLFVDERTKQAQLRQLQFFVENLQALGILDEHGQQVQGHMIRHLRGIDGPFVYYCLRNYNLVYEGLRELCEYVVDHDVIHRLLRRAEDEKRREWCRARLRERRQEEPQVSWEDVEEEYDRLFPRPLAPIEVIHQEFCSKLPHPELHGGKVHKTIWARMEDEELGFMDFVERHGLENEEGNLFTYLARVMKVARTLKESTELPEFAEIERRIRSRLAAVEERIIEDLWSL
ncbi:MAG: DEAD/DEAH box helicase [Myxococcales bacterium]|nr:DEAD/DEAH box helicase [Myxococcota bacterium]MDW8281784.1 DEAD/DEAH box helicase [Myxococcales bacterium]